MTTVESRYAIANEVQQAIHWQKYSMPSVGILSPVLLSNVCVSFASISASFVRSSRSIKRHRTSRFSSYRRAAAAAAHKVHGQRRDRA